MTANYCGLYPTSEVLPDEDGNCSLCGSEINGFGECLFKYKTDSSVLALELLTKKAMQSAKYTQYGGFNAKKHKATCDKNRKKRKRKNR